MIKVKKLKHYETMADLELNQCYLGKVLPNKLIALNNSVKVKAINSELIKEKKEVAVQITKINIPYSVEAKIIDEEYELIEEITDIASFSLEDIGKKFTLYVTIEEIQQTSGPTIFILFDGTAALTAKAYAGPGKRAFPNIEKGDVMKVFITLREYDGILEAELNGCEQLKENKEQQLINKIKRRLEEESRPLEVDFLIKSETLEKLRPRIVETARRIREAILSNRPIILRHHADTDGYTGAIALERAILPLIVKHHKDEKAQWYYYRRAPSKIPFYEYGDATKDLTMTLENMSRHGQKEPLIIIVDNGSTKEDMMAIKKVKIYDARVVVIDHHFCEVVDGRSEVDKFIDGHVNPYLVGDKSDLCAGMLATEVARFVNKDVKNINFLPALAGIGDKMKNEEFQQYLAIAAKNNYSSEYLKELAECIDFEACYLKFIESRGLVDDLLGKDMEKQKKLVSLLKEDIIRKREQQLKVVQRYVEAKDFGKAIFTKIDIDRLMFKAEYPPPGKIVGLVHDSIKEKTGKEALTIGHSSEFITMRITDGINIDVNNLIKQLQEEKPYGFIAGGGHKKAGTIRFVSAVKDEIISYIEDIMQMV